ncbi:hypothetical protein ACFY9R_26690 [Streptomyces albidoflavus]|uniref:hypothetical protein n=1 Tax=Streptomyces albidoflavus TaxID=1886 RepID=UPI0033F379F1
MNQPNGQYQPQPYQPAPPNAHYPSQPYAQGPRTVVTKRGANHGLHLFLSFITLGLWAITGWPIAAMLGRKTKTRTY